MTGLFPVQHLVLTSNPPPGKSAAAFAVSAKVFIDYEYSAAGGIGPPPFSVPSGTRAYFQSHFGARVSPKQTFESFGGSREPRGRL
jgi:hypothetical protein